MSEQESKNAVRLTSLLLVEERLCEAQYFTCRLRNEKLLPQHIRYEFNAFLSAARSVTFLLQKEMKIVPGFLNWWQLQQEKMRKDCGMRFFLELRNFSQKEGRISIASADVFQHSWSHRLVSNSVRVPDELLHRDVWDCCADHLGKLARIVLQFAEKFPIYSCPHRAITPRGLRELEITPFEIGLALGIPEDFMHLAPKMTTSDFCRILRRHCDGVDFDALLSIAHYTPQPCDPSDSRRDQFLKTLVENLEDQASMNQRGESQRRQKESQKGSN